MSYELSGAEQADKSESNVVPLMRRFDRYASEAYELSLKPIEFSEESSHLIQDWRSLYADPEVVAEAHNTLQGMEHRGEAPPWLSEILYEGSRLNRW